MVSRGTCNGTDEYLLQLSKRNDAIELQQRQSFGELSATLKFFIDQYAAGHNSMADLVKSEHDLTRQNVDMRILRAEATIMDHITSEVDKLKINHATQAQRERLLKSLKYNPMGERYSNLDPHRSTFRWVFSPDQVPKDVRGSSAYWPSFAKWAATSNSDLYWIRGKPGAGKSTFVKFLVDSTETKSALCQWQPDVKIIHHFFWRAGTTMQRSLKGFICSLCYQLLLKSPEAVDIVIAQYESAVHKDWDSEWSLRDLNSVLHTTLEHVKPSICFFIDGLDEISEDDAPDLTQLVDDLNARDNIKICLASRPEFFPRREQGIRILQLQDLTAQDMQKYIHAELGASLDHDNFDENLEDDLTAKLVQKAEGVFIWLSFAVKTLKRGIRKRNSRLDLMARLEQLPDTLTALYEDMWLRLNEDSHVHRKKGARYLRVIKDHFDSERAQRDEVPHFSSTISLLQLTLAMNPEIRDRIFDEHAAPVAVSKLGKLCEETENDLHTRCAGLLELLSWDLTVNEMKAKGVPHGNILMDQDFDGRWMQPIVFVHRTAYDFLDTCEDGRGILSYDKSSAIDVRMQWIYGRIAIDCLCEYRFGFDTPLGTILSPLCTLLLDDENAKKQVEDVLELCWDLFDRGYLTPEPCERPTFLAVVAHLPALESFVVTRVAQGSQSLSAEVLRNLTYSWYQLEPIISQRPGLVRRLHSLGAGSNEKGVVLVDRPSTLQDSSQQQLGIFRSPIGQFLISYFWSMTRFSHIGFPVWRVAIPSNFLHTLLNYIEAGGSLSQRTSLAVEGDYRFLSFSDWSRAYFIPNEMKWGGGRKKHGNLYIFEVNLAFLAHWVCGLFEQDGLDQIDSAAMAKIRGFPTSAEIPMATLRYVATWRNDVFRKYACRSEGVFRDPLPVTPCWGCCSEKHTPRVGVEAFGRLAKLIRENIDDPTLFVALDEPWSSLLAKEELGYCLKGAAEDDLSSKPRQEI